VVNPAEALNAWALAWGFVAAWVVLAIGVGLDLGLRKEPVSRAVRAAWVVAAVGAGIVVAYYLNSGWSGGKGERAWWEGEARQMLAPAAALATLLVLLMRGLPQVARWVVWAVLAVGMTLLVVRGPWMGTESRPAWEGWATFAGGLLGLLALYAAALAPSTGEREAKLWLVPLGVLWVASSAAGICVMLAFDMVAGRMFVYLAVMAGVAIVAGIWRRLRDGAAWAGLLLAAVYAAAWTSAAFFDSNNDWVLSKAAMGLLAAAPAAGGLAWIPALRRRPWACVTVAVGLAILLVVPALVMAGKAAPPMN
jgi:hypothetical protein